MVDASGCLASPGMTRISLRQDGIDADTDGSPGDVNNEGSILLSTPAERLASLQHFVLLDGTFGDAHALPLEGASQPAEGAHVPGIVQMRFFDRMRAGTQPTWSAGDALQLRFDSALNVKPAWPLKGSRSFVDALFSFSDALGDDYTGEWRDASTFVVTVLRTASVPPVLNASASAVVGATTVRVIGNVRNSAATDAPRDDVPVALTGDFGSDEAPEAQSVIARDPDNSGLGFEPGDTLTMSFSLPTNRDTASGAKIYVDSLFTFDPPVGDDYSGEWQDDSTFIVTIQTVGDAAPVLGTARAMVSGSIFDDELRRPSALGQSATLIGGYGRSGAPRIVRFEADDPADLDSVYGPGDLLTIGFDQATDRGVGGVREHARTCPSPMIELALV